MPRAQRPKGKVDVDFTLRRVFRKETFRYLPMFSLHDRDIETDLPRKTPTARSNHGSSQWPRCVPASRHLFRQESLFPAPCGGRYRKYVSVINLLAGPNAEYASVTIVISPLLALMVNHSAQMQAA